MKYSVFTVGLPESTPEEALQKLKKYGYDGVEWRVTKIASDPAIVAQKPSYWGNNLCTVDESRMAELAPGLKTLCEKYDAQVCALGTYMRSDADSATIEAAMELAKTLNCPQIRISPSGYDGTVNYRTLFDKAVCDYRRIEALAKKHGVKVNLEMHMGTLTASASAAYRLVSHFDPRYIGVIYDTGNVVYEGYENYQMALEILGEYLAHVHIKNAKWVLEGETNGIQSYKAEWTSFKTGQADFTRFLKALKNFGYDGWLTFEDFSDADADEKLASNIQYIKSIVDSL